MDVDYDYRLARPDGRIKCGTKTGFISEDGSTMIVPMELEQGLGNSEFSKINDKASEIGNKIADKGYVPSSRDAPAGFDTVI